MKKLSFILGVVAIMAFSSCSKEKECKCITSSTGSPDMTTTMTIKSGKCSDMNSSASVNGMTTSVNCTEQ